MKFQFNRTHLSDCPKAFDKYVDDALIDIFGIYEQDDYAGFLVKFKPICGDYKKYFHAVYMCNEICIGIISYSTASKSELDKLKSTKQNGIEWELK